MVRGGSKLDAEHEEALVNNVAKRQMEVDRLERELKALKAHERLLHERFSVAMHPPAGASKQRQSSPSSSRPRKAVEFGDGADRIEEDVPVRNPVPTETLSSSPSASDSKKAKNVMDRANANGSGLMKVERPGVKLSLKKLPRDSNGISSRVSEKKLENSPGSSSDDSESSDEASSNYEGSEGSEESEESEESDEFETEGPHELLSGNPVELKSEDPVELDSENPDELDSEDPDDSDSKEIVSSNNAADNSTQQKPSPMKVKSPAKLKSPLSREKAKTTWKTKTTAPSSSSDDSSSDEDDERNKRHAGTGRASLGPAKEAKVLKPVSATSLSPDASDEDLFDWIILGLQGPWLPLASIEESSGASELKDQALPLKFSSRTAYSEMFQKLIGEEAKATLLSEWDQLKVEQDLHAKFTTESSKADSRGQSSVWQLRSMVQTMGDPFHYFEAECTEGPNFKFDAGEFLCMIGPGTGDVKAVAIVNHQNRYQAPLLKTRVPCDSSLDKCVLLRLCNMVTLRRMFLAVSSLSDIFSPLQRQILDPMANRKFLKPLPAFEDIVGGDLKLKLSSESLRNFGDRKILNAQQLLTVSSVLNMGQGFQLVQGPPGTGKTSTIVGMVSTLLIEEPGIRILVCAPSNAALDEVAARLMHQMLDKSGNTYSPMDGTIVRFGGKRVMHPIVQLISLDSLAARLSSSSHRSRAWVDILDAASVVCATLSGCGNTTFDELEKMFDVVIIDEAAQAVEAEVLIPLKRVKGRCVMVGDPQQLPATVFQRPSVAYGRSLFERFQEGGVVVHVLAVQYRMHPSIVSYPSRRFYNGGLQNSTQTSNMRSIFSEKFWNKGTTVRGCRFKLGEYCFMDVGWGTEREELVGHSRANHEEALVVCNVVEGVVKGLLPGLKPNVGVITPYIAQRGVIECELGKRGIDTTACEVNTVDGFQGREKDVIVLSCVRAMADRGLGFVSDERRMNVALTRAKYSLIIVGHAETLQKWSPAWGSLIVDARKRGCYQVLTNNKIQGISPKNWKPSPPPQKDMYGMEQVEEHTKLSTADTTSSKIVNGKQDKEKARKGEGDTQSSKRAGVGEKANDRTKVKLKRKALDVEGSRKTSLDMPPVNTKRKATGNFPDLQCHPKKNNKNELGENVTESSEKKRKKLHVELDVAEPSATMIPRKKLIEVKEEFPKPKEGKMKPVMCLTAPALDSASNRKGEKTHKSPVQLKKPKLETPAPESSTEGREAGAAELPLETDSVKPEEVTVHEVTSSARGDGLNDPGKTEILVEMPADPIPQSVDRTSGTEKRSKGWFQNSVSGDDRCSPLKIDNRQLPPRSDHPGQPIGSTQGFVNFDEHVAASRQPHWGNSYHVSPGPHNRFHGNEMDTITSNLDSVLARANNHLRMQPNFPGNFQQVPQNHWQHHSSAHISPHASQSGVYRHPPNFEHRQPPQPSRPTHFASPQNHYSGNSQSPRWRGRGRGRGRGQGQGRGHKGHSGGRSGDRQSCSGW